MKIKIHKEGWVYFILSFIIAIITIPFFPIIGIIFMIISIYIFYFFRDPIRSIPLEDIVVSPADGLITFIGKAKPPLNLGSNEKFFKISIFLSIFNVHVNRIPSDGIIKTINYVPGKFINASLDKSSSKNERNIILIEKDNKDIIIVTQIAGLIARRIICNLKEKQKVFQGYKFGIIKFGSRVDIYLPLNYKPLVTLGQTVIGGETILSNPNNVKKLTNSLKI